MIKLILFQLTKYVHYTNLYRVAAQLKNVSVIIVINGFLKRMPDLSKL